MSRTLLVAIIVIASLACGHIASAQTDVTPPQLVSLSLMPDALDLRQGDAALTIAYAVADDLSGATSFAVRLATPGGECLAGANQSFAAALMHDDQVSLTFGRYSTAPGVWQVCEVTLCDARQNCRTLGPADLAAMGAAPTVNIIAMPDTEPPALTALSLDSSVIDLTLGSATLAVNYQARDDRSGVGSVFVTLQPPGGQCDRTASDSFFATQERNGTVDFPFDQFATPPGSWTVCEVDVCDAAFNCRTYALDALEAAGLAAQFEVIAQPDLTPPTLQALAVEPASANVATGPVTTVIHYTATDTGSGIATIAITLDVPGEGCTREIDAPGTGGARDLRLQLGIFNAPLGSWAVCRLQLCDRVGNCVAFDRAALIAAGLDATFVVIDVPPQGLPDATVNAAGDWSGQLIADNGLSSDATAHFDQTGNLLSGELRVADSICLAAAAVEGVVTRNLLIGDAHSAATGLSFRVTASGTSLSGPYVAGTDCLHGNIGTLVLNRPATATPTVTATRTRTPTASPTPNACAGDCDGNLSVSIDEIVRAVGIALGAQEITACLAADRNHDGVVTIDEIIAAVGFALGNCPG